MYVQINIGRNVGTVPMQADRWEQFILSAKAVLCHAANDSGGGARAAKYVETHKGQGIWDGGREDSAHISLYWEPGFNVYWLRKRLATLRDAYGQESIALILGSELI